MGRGTYKSSPRSLGLTYRKFGRITPTCLFSGGDSRGSSPEKIIKNFKSRNAGTCYSSLKLSDFVGCLDATNREPARTGVEAHVDIAADEVEVVGVGTIRPG